MVSYITGNKKNMTPCNASDIVISKYFFMKILLIEINRMINLRRYVNIFLKLKKKLPFDFRPRKECLLLLLLFTLV